MRAGIYIYYICCKQVGTAQAQALPVASMYGHISKIKILRQSNQHYRNYGI